jgi:hypothetical protein
LRYSRAHHKENVLSEANIYSVQKAANFADFFLTLCVVCT